WVVTGTQPAQPSIACYETATFNGTTCQWVVTGSPNPAITTTASACDSYVWSANGSTYTASGTYNYSANCQDYVLNLTVTASTSNTTTASACNSYTWSVNGATYTQSGTYTSVSGCHTETLSLTVTASSSNTTTASACDSYTWSVNGATYTQSGTYISVSGCHTDVLSLTITPSSSNTTTAAACGSYFWSVTGQAYTQSGTYSSVSGCHTEILSLTVTPITSNSTSASACDSYTWSVNGQTYTQSGTYNSVNGCHTEVLFLTVSASTSNTTTLTSCEQYTWNANGQTYTQTGVYTSVSGCNTEILDLTISPLNVSASVTSPIACFGGTGVVTVSATGGQAPLYGTGAQVTAAGTWTFTVTDDNGCSATSSSVTLTEPSKVQGSTSTTSSNCGSSNGSATVTASGGAGGYSYLWSDGQTTATATGLGIGSYSVTITDANGCTGTAAASVGGIGGAPGAAGAVTGPNGACRNTTATFSIASVAGASTYSWSLPAGATGSSTSTSITVTFTNTYNGGFICVTPTNSCGNGAQSCINVPVITVAPTQPGTITLSAPACGPAVITCSVAPVANATSYNWTVSGSQATILSGQGTRTITLNVPAGFTNAQLGVSASNCIASSTARYQTIIGLAVINTGLTGPIYLCANTTQNYSVGTAIGATSYTWSISGNATIQSSTGTQCVVKTNAGWTGGVLTVSAINSCGSNPRSFTLYKTPLQPGAMTGPATDLCYAAGARTATYSIAAVAGATSYSWAVPTGMSITSNTGTSITVSIASNFTGGNVSVTANGSCGASTPRTLVVSTKPAVPGAISGATSVCKSQSSVSYSIAAVSGATSYAWSVSGGAYIAPGSTAALVDYRTATTATAVITVNAVNQCGASSPQRLSVTVNLACRESNFASQQALTAFPNPTNGKVTMSFNAPTADRYLVRVVDLIGKVVYSGDLNAEAGLNTKEIDLSSMSKGIYILNVQTEGGEAQTLRLIVE
ncbi:MAG: T9SS type A sorting domain-containing protein, partial [Bacteroidota bacterium]